MPRQRILTNRPHWHVLCRTGAIWTMAGVRMDYRERDAEREHGRRRVVRRWFTSSTAASKAKARLEAAGKQAMTYQCPNPDWCPHGPPD